MPGPGSFDQSQPHPRPLSESERGAEGGVRSCLLLIQMVLLHLQPADAHLLRLAE